MNCQWKKKYLDFKAKKLKRLSCQHEGFPGGLPPKY